MAGARSPRRKTVTLCVTVTAPGWLRKAALRREVRTLINDGTAWGTERPRDLGADYEAINLGDIRVRRMR
ncbi:MAG TPA: hypothetical protein VFW22_16280 [Pseudolabrys sp.]|nr:hypothetical protein [Pseudolabrys sp.]